MKILHVLWYARYGGVETYTKHLFEHLEALGHANVLVTSGEHPVSALGVRESHALDGIIQRGSRVAACVVPELARVIEQSQPDVAIIHTAMNQDAAEFVISRLPTAFFAHSYGAFCPSGALLYERTDDVCDIADTPNWKCLLNAYAERCNTAHPTRLLDLYGRAREMRRWVSKVHAIICDSGFVADRHTRAGFPATRIHVLPSPVEVPPMISLENLAPERRILFAGRLVRAKGGETLIRAMPRVPTDWSLRIVGEGPERLTLLELATRLAVQERVEFVGAVESSRMGDEYRATAIVAVPSIWPEPLGMVGPEALAFGRAVVGSGRGGMHEWLVDGLTGLVATPGDADHWAEQLVRLTSDPSLRERLGAEGRRLVERRFTFSSHVEQLRRVLDGARATFGNAPR